MPPAPAARSRPRRPSSGRLPVQRRAHPKRPISGSVVVRGLSGRCHTSRRHVAWPSGHNATVVSVSPLPMSSRNSILRPAFPCRLFPFSLAFLPTLSAEQCCLTSSAAASAQASRYRRREEGRGSTLARLGLGMGGVGLWTQRRCVHACVRASAQHNAHVA